MKNLTLKLAGVLILLSLNLSTAKAGYLKIGFNQISGGGFWPIAGAVSDQQAGFVTPAIVHNAADGYLLIPGISWNPLNLGYVGKTTDFLAGKVAIGPSVQMGALVKRGISLGCTFLPGWLDPNSYNALKAVLSNDSGYYIDAGVYEAFATNEFNRLNKVKPQTLIGAVLSKSFGGK
jgi:hypothetical protein